MFDLQRLYLILIYPSLSCHFFFNFISFLRSGSGPDSFIFFFCRNLLEKKLNGAVMKRRGTIFLKYFSRRGQK